MGQTTQFELFDKWGMFLNGEHHPSFFGAHGAVVECQIADVTVTGEGEIQCTLLSGESVSITGVGGFHATAVTSVIIRASRVKRL